MNPNRYRITYALLGLALGAVVIGAILFAPSGTVTELPDVVDEISPEDGATVLRQTGLEIDLAVDYSLELFIDGVRIPSSEITFNNTTGEYRWAPGPTSTFPEWTPGFHQIEILWDRITGLPDPGGLRWSFRVQ